MDRIARVKSRVLEVKSRVGLAAATPLLDRVQNVLAQRAAGGGVLAGLRGAAAPTALPALPALPATTPAPATQIVTEEELGVEAR